MIKKIAIIGPESTGKSILTSELAKHYKTVSVPEYAREFLAKHNNTYAEIDLVEIAKGQQNSIEENIQEANTFLFIDTELLVIKISVFYVCLLFSLY